MFLHRGFFIFIIIFKKVPIYKNKLYLVLKLNGMEKILRIEDCNFKTKENDWGGYDGYRIVTDLQTVHIGISDSQCCCENFGCLITNDDISDFVNAELKSISIVDTALNNKKIDEIEYLDAGGAMFVNFETSNGLLQFVAYNSHNGYYGHEAVLISKQLNYSESL